MEGFVISLKTTELEFELGVDKLEEQDKDFIREILTMIDRKSVTPLEYEKRDGLKIKYKNAAEGYQALSTDIQGFHKGVDEYIAKEVETEIEEEKKASVQVKAEDEKIENEEKEKETVKPSFKEQIEKAYSGYYEKTDNISIVLNNEKKELYQTYYICPKCKNRGKRFIPKHATHTNCHSCFNQMRIKSASLKGFPNKDKFGNIFVAGEFKPSPETQEIESQKFEKIYV